jgi:hypothetical protein
MGGFFDAARPGPNGRGAYHGQRKLIWLLEAVRVEVKLEDELLALRLGEHLGSKRNISCGREKVHA